jgi:peptidoglycan hydrolase-like protein with peptidoglycan-binding domain
MLRTKTIIVAAVFAFSGLVGLLAPASANAATTKKPCVQQTFRSGANHICVNYIQTMLNISAKSGLQTDKKFGRLTKAAVIKWQTDKKIQVDGVVGPETWGTLCAVPDGFDVAYKAHKVLAECDKQLSCVDRKYSTSTNSRNAYCVKQIQGMLNLAHGTNLDVDGRFGAKTKAAVKAWQKKQKESDKKMLVDGIVGKQTWGKLCAHKMPSTAEQTTYDANRRAAGCK